MEFVFGSVACVVPVYVGTMMIAFRLPKRKFYWPIAIFFLLYLPFLRHGLDQCVVLLGQATGMDMNWSVFLRATNLLLILLISFLIVLVTQKTTPFVAAYCASIGYILEFILDRSYRLLSGLFSWNFEKWGEMLFMLGTMAVFYCAVFFLIRRYWKEAGVLQKNKSSLLVLVFTAVAFIYLSAFGSVARNFTYLRRYFSVALLLTAFVCLWMQGNIFLRLQKEKEVDALRYMLNLQKEQYQIGKTVIETINLKAHDLKHQLIALDGRIDSEEYAKLRQAVDVYDATFKTGNSAINLILTTKTILCESKGITFTCHGDGTLFSFMSESDTYSLFGNIIDNAIEASEKLLDKKSATISLNFRADGGLVLLECSNYFQDPPTVVNGVFRSTKGDDANHGFGMTSIRHITDSYHGYVNYAIEGNVFIIRLAFPLEK